MANDMFETMQLRPRLDARFGPSNLGGLHTSPRRSRWFSVCFLGLASILGACSNEGAKQDELAVHDPALWPTRAMPVQDSEVEQRISALIAEMSNEEKVGQILQAEIQMVTPEDVRKYHLGSVLNGGGSIPYRLPDAKAEDWLRMADALYDASMDDSDGKVAIPIIWGTDAVHGHGNVVGATLFPHNIGLGAADNPAMMSAIGAATAREVRATGVDWIFAPTLAVARNDRWGRTYESYSEDPDRVARLGAALIEGMQGQHGSDAFLDDHHAIASAKHFLADGGTANGDDQGDARMSEAELVAVHGTPYLPALDAGVQTIMASFSAWNGEKMHSNGYLLNDILKTRLGFDGFIVGDWNGHGQVPGCDNSHCAASINAGVDLIMVPYDWRKMYGETLSQVESGEISQARLNDAVRRILRVKIRAGLFERRPSDTALAGDQSVIGHPDHRALARQAVRESLVLLKHRDSVLPISPKAKVLVVGKAAQDLGQQAGGWSVSWQGMEQANEHFPGATSIYSGLEAAITSSGGEIQFSEDGRFSSRPDVAVFVFGESPYAEGQGDRNSVEYAPGDRSDLEILQTLKAEGVPVVSVFLSGRPMWVNPHLNASDAFVAAWLPGSEGAGVADVLIGDAQGQPRHDFVGTLAFSWPALPDQAELHAPYEAQDAPLFELGYGLTYASGETGPATLPESVPGLYVANPNQIDLYSGRPLEPWNLYLNGPDSRQILSGAYAALPGGNITLNTADKEVQEDALQLQFKDTWRAEVSFENGRPLALSSFHEAGVLRVDLNIFSMPAADLRIELRCGEGCQGQVSLNEWARAQVGKGWQTLSIPLSCFVSDAASLSSVNMPFVLNAGGEATLQFANIQFLRSAQGNFDCVPPDAQSTYAEPLNAYWALPWWMPRHEEKLALVRANQYPVIFMGDSITEGWADAGRSVWDAHFASLPALNLGYGGDRTENLLWRVQNGEMDGQRPKVVVLMIGTNNTGHRMDPPAEIAEGVEAVIDEVHARSPDSKVLLLGIFPRGEQPYDAARQNNTATNALLAQLGQRDYVTYLDIGDTFLDDQGVLSREVMPDLLHLNTASYQRWADAIESTLQALLEE